MKVKELKKILKDFDDNASTAIVMRIEGMTHLEIIESVSDNNGNVQLNGESFDDPDDYGTDRQGLSYLQLPQPMEYKFKGKDPSVLDNLEPFEVSFVATHILVGEYKGITVDGIVGHTKAGDHFVIEGNTYLDFIKNFKKITRGK